MSSLVVNEDDRLFGFFDEVGNEAVSIEDLSIKENALLGRCLRINFFENLVNSLVGFNLVILDVGKTLKHLGVAGKEMAHGSESPHNADVGFNGRW